MSRVRSIAVMLGVAALLVSNANAYLTSEWDDTGALSADVFSLGGGEPTGDQSNPFVASWDIADLFYYQDHGASHYFRMDMDGPIPGGGTFIYGVYVDHSPGGSPAEPAYSGAIAGIDTIVRAVYSGGVLSSADYLTWNGAAWNAPVAVGSFAANEAGSSTGVAIEWAIPEASMGPYPAMTLYGVASGGLGLDRDDTIGLAVVPEPGTMALLGTLGAVGAAMKRRKKKTELVEDEETPQVS